MINTTFLDVAVEPEHTGNGIIIGIVLVVVAVVAAVLIVRSIRKKKNNQ